MKKTITQAEYNRLSLLLALAKLYNRELDKLVFQALEITEEYKKSTPFSRLGYTADAIFMDEPIEKLLKNLNIGVVGDKNPSAST